MSKKNIAFVCQSCALKAPKWLGKCPECNEWNTFQEEHILRSSKPGIEIDKGKPKRLNEIPNEISDRTQTGFYEFDRVVGGGIVNGSLILIGGEPGIGKSTLLTEVMGRLASLSPQEKVLYISGEESEGQVANRIKRLEINEDNYYIYNETSWQEIHKHLIKLRPKFIVLDSIQTTISQDISSAPGTVSQIREVTYELMNFVKGSETTCFLIGHITKEGAIAGPKILEHMVDTVIYFEGDKFSHYRILRAIKNRFGNTNEVGIFEMKGNGLSEVTNPTQCFLADQLAGSYGYSLTCIVEGSRSLFVEIQALVVENKGGNGRRTTQGLDSNRLAMLLAVIEKYCQLPLGFSDVYLNVIGGVKLVSRESDLSIIASILSSYHSRPLNNSTIYLGEVGLSGELRAVVQIESRLKEISQLKYKRVITSTKTAMEYNGQFSLEVIGINYVGDLINILWNE